MGALIGIAIIAIISIGISNLIKSKSSNNNKISAKSNSNNEFAILNQQKQNISHLHDQHARVFDDDCNHPGCDSHDSGSFCDSGSDGGCSGGCD